MPVAQPHGHGGSARRNRNRRVGSVREEGRSGLAVRCVPSGTGGHTQPMRWRPGPGAAPPTSGPEFGVLLEGAKSGTGPACTRLYEWLAPVVAGYLRAQGADDPDDLVSEVFLRVFAGCRSFTGTEAQFRAWVFTIAHSRLVDARRVKARSPEMKALDEECGDGQGPTTPGAEEEALVRLAVGEVGKLLEALTSDQRDVLALRIVTQMSVEEVATVLGKPQGRSRPCSIGPLPPSGVGCPRKRCSNDRMGTERTRHRRGRGP